MARELGTYKAVAAWYEQTLILNIERLGEAVKTHDSFELKFDIDVVVGDLKFALDAHKKRIEEVKALNEEMRNKNG